jgi:nickel/cobalt transporter (NicO) family protein
MKFLRIATAFAASVSAPTVLFAASSPFGIATPDSPVGNGIGGPAAPLLLAAIHLQTIFYQKLTAALDAFSDDPHAAFWLVGLSFLYGILHAVGPGHGKAVISSYVLATGERLRQATAMSVIASMLQALSAMAIIFTAVEIFDATAADITAVTDKLELGSYGLIALLGLTLMASRGRRLASQWRGERASLGSFYCEPLKAGQTSAPPPGRTGVKPHLHGPDCGCVEISRLVAANPRMSSKERLQAIASIGIRPCSGALIVLVFALSRHLVLAGVLSVFAISAGTAFTVSIIAALSVFCRGILARLALTGDTASPRIAIGVEFVCACGVLAFGMVMIAGLLATNTQM